MDEFKKLFDAQREAIKQIADLTGVKRFPK